jgi:Capsule assembly protein Wzi/PAP2 superfamily
LRLAGYNGFVVMFVWCTIAFASAGLAQTAESRREPGSAPARSEKSSAADDQSHHASAAPGPLLRNLVDDQKNIWTSPFKARVEDLNWLAPAVGLTAGLINADAELSSRISTTGTFTKHSGTVSNAGVALMVGGAGSLYLVGKLRSDDHQQEAGILAGEAAVNSLMVAEILKVATRRERPTEGTGQGRFGHSSSAYDSSFPSVHAAIAWSAASVLAHEYPGVMTQILGYGLATGVSIARVTGRNHFPSDVVVGSTVGWLIGRQVYAAHHNSALAGGDYGTFISDSSSNSENRSIENAFSPYVPVDSWIYPAFERLFALGAIPSGFLGQRPWTRAECARLLEEADAEVADDSSDETARLLDALKREFSSELNGAESANIGIDSVYTRAVSISGPPLTDGYHFNKTIPYDFGRPYERGTNYIAGFSSSGSAGILGFYLRGEYDHAPSAPGVPQAVQDAIQVADGKPVVQPAAPIAAFNRPRIVEGYVSLNLKGWQTSFGKQSLWTGPTRDPLEFSNNAEGLYMFRVDQTSPRKLPGFLRWLGPYRSNFFFGEVTGHHFVNEETGAPIVFSIGRTLPKQPMMHAEKLSFKPTPNFEFGVSVSTMWGGPGIPITAGEVRRTLASLHNVTGPLDAGDRNSYFDWSYRLPGLRKWLMIYEDSFTEDEISPIGYPRRSAHNPGIYMPQLPMLHHMDFRFEGGFTDLPGLLQPPGGGFYYWNIGYLDGHTNKGNIMGSTIGRQGVSFRAATTYWVASDKTIQLSYRNMETSPEFLQGGNLRDIQVRSEWSFSPSVSLSSFVQYEWWNYPVLSLGNKQTNFTASFQLTYWPHWRIKRGS